MQFFFILYGSNIWLGVIWISISPWSENNNYADSKICCSADNRFKYQTFKIKLIDVDITKEMKIKQNQNTNFKQSVIMQ